jgi:HEAT repeat protein
MLCPMLAKSSFACLGVLLGSACAPSATEADFESAHPAARLYAIEAAAERKDPTDTPSIVEQLDSDDPAVRLMAIEALERITGETFDYHHDDPSYMREAAIKRWVLAVQEGRVASGSGVTPRDNDG